MLRSFLISMVQFTVLIFIFLFLHGLVMLISTNLGELDYDSLRDRINSLVLMVFKFFYSIVLSNLCKLHKSNN